MIRTVGKGGENHVNLVNPVKKILINLSTSTPWKNECKRWRKDCLQNTRRTYRLSDIKLHIWFDSAHHDLVTLSEVEGEKV